MLGKFLIAKYTIFLFFQNFKLRCVFFFAVSEKCNVYSNLTRTTNCLELMNDLTDFGGNVLSSTIDNFQFYKNSSKTQNESLEHVRHIYESNPPFPFILNQKQSSYRHIYTCKRC